MGVSSKRNIHGLTLTLDAKGFSSRPRTRMNGGPWPNTVAIDLGQTPRPPTVHSRPFAWLRQVLAKMLQQIGWTTVATETLLVKQARSLSRRLPTRPSVACFASLFHLFPPQKKGTGKVLSAAHMTSTSTSTHRAVGQNRSKPGGPKPSTSLTSFVVHSVLPIAPQPLTHCHRGFPGPHQRVGDGGRCHVPLLPSTNLPLRVRRVGSGTWKASAKSHQPTLAWRAAE